MSLFVSNPTTQHFELMLREPRNNKLLRVAIPSGRQTQIGHDWSAEEKAKVIRQLEKFGARDAAESYGKLSKFLGLLYRDAAAVSEEEIRQGHAAVVTAQEERSVEAATTGALAFDRAVNNPDPSKPRRERRARVTAVEVEEAPAPGSRPTGDEVRMSVTVDPEGRSDPKALRAHA